MKRSLCLICLLSLLISGCQDVSVNHPEASWGGFQISEDIPELQIEQEQIELLSQIRDELKKFNERKM